MYLPRSRGGIFGPDFFVGVAGGLDGFIDVFVVAIGDFGELLFRRGIDGVEILFPWRGE
jgi:hypothetical protein